MHSPQIYAPPDRPMGQIQRYQTKNNPQNHHLPQQQRLGHQKHQEETRRTSSLVNIQQMNQKTNPRILKPKTTTKKLSKVKTTIAHSRDHPPLQSPSVRVIAPHPGSQTVLNYTTMQKYFFKTSKVSEETKTSLSTFHAP